MLVRHDAPTRPQSRPRPLPQPLVSQPEPHRPSTTAASFISLLQSAYNGAVTRPSEVEALWAELQQGPDESRSDGHGGDSEALVELRKLIRERGQLEGLLAGVDYVVAENAIHRIKQDPAR